MFVNKKYCPVFLFPIVFLLIFLAFLFIICILTVFSPILIPFVGLFILAKVMRTFQKEYETLETLSMYEKRPGQAQRFLARVSKNFRWPTSMPEYIRRGTFMYIIDDDDQEFGLEVGLNHLFFYNALDNGEFAGHENEWVTVHNQRSTRQDCHVVHRRRW
ncbi:unnamed protein product [Rhizophagus irregularis]|nr:unnamed protein product [Rhizophagus irregularis]CAB5361570.1 unnamed protein product [Rhizophagus irregularis]